MDIANKSYYYVNDTTRIDTFLAIPKILFYDERFKHLNLLAKIIYSLYLNRYSNTIYKDKTGPYIIYSDTDIAEKLDIARTSVIRQRNALKNAGLIDFAKSIGNNKIYLLNYNRSSSSDVFYYEEDLEGFKFIRFPLEFFDEKYKNLPLKAKFIYSLYFDSMCLSQMNYFVDDKERIYFQESLFVQKEKLNISTSTIQKYREYLKACHLLFEYSPFASPIRFYILKLNHFQDNVFEFESIKDKKQKKEYLAKVTNDLKESLIIKPQKRDMAIIKKKRIMAEITQKELTEIICKELDIHLSPETYRKYESGRRNPPERIYEFLNKFFDGTLINKNETINGTQISKIEIDMGHTNKKIEQSIGTKDIDIETIDNKVLEQISIEKSNNQNLKKQTNINKTNFIQTNHNETIYNENILLINIINDIISLVYNSSYLEEKQKQYIIACFDKLKVYQKFYITQDDYLVNADELCTYLTPLLQEEVLNKKCISILHRIIHSGYHFKTPDNQINCFITFLLNDLRQTEKEDIPSWFSSVNSILEESLKQQKKSESSHIDVSDEIKNLKWWE